MAAESASRFQARSKSVPDVPDTVKLELHHDDDTLLALQDTPLQQSLPQHPNLHNLQYPGLKSAGKRKRDDTADSKTDRPPAVDARTSKSTSRPYAPPNRPRVQRAPITNKFIVNTRMTSRPAESYIEYNPLKMYKRSDLATLVYTIDLVKQCIQAIKTGDDREIKFSVLRRRLHQMEFYDFIEDILVVKSKLLEDHGFPAIFNNLNFPFDLRADALLLFKKWATRQWDPDLLRGIVTKMGTNSRQKDFNTKALDKHYPRKAPANYHGEGELVNGQWWPLQLCTIRDGAHGLAEGGIYGQLAKGAYSIIMSGGGYADIDEGDIIQYCGTSGEEHKPTAFTERMLESSRLKNPVRVLRSAGLAGKHSQYRPAKGIRYDGTYNVTGYELLNKGTSMYRFTLVRCPGQDPIRYQGAEVRPTEEELRAYSKIEGYLKSSE
ncbi:MAG: hypothetical protein LQ348_005101 [Seirophora lacunosa]|nr:MAG: hypothetical protein LQ348_005101 [Seirophora lacunosa]